MSKHVWRLIAIFIAFVWVIVFVTNNYLNELYKTPIQEIIFDNIILAIPMIIVIMLIFFPQKFILYTVVFCYLGVDNIINGGGTNGLLMYLLGGGFLYISEKPFKNKLVIGIYIGIPIIAITTQYRLDTITMVVSFLDLLFVCALFVMGYFILKESFLITRKRKTTPVNVSCLSTEELSYVHDVLNGKSFSAIGLERYKSESSIKQIMSAIYRKLNIENKKELIELHEKGLLIFPE